MIGRNRRVPALIGMVCLAATAIGLAGCGDGSADGDEGGVATIAASEAADESTSDTDPTSDDDAEAPTDMDEAFELFNDCMAELGFEIDAAGPGSDSGEVIVEGGSSSAEAGEGPVIMGPGGVRIDPEDAEKWEEANETCSVHLANVQDELTDVSPEQQAAMEDAVLRVQECMQEKGFDVQMSVSVGGGPGVADAGTPRRGRTAERASRSTPTTSIARRSMQRLASATPSSTSTTNSTTCPCPADETAAEAHRRRGRAGRGRRRWHVVGSGRQRRR